MLYDEMAIKKIGEERIEDALLNDEKINISSHDQDEVILLYGLEHYIVKYVNNPKTSELKKKIDERISGLINLYEYSPKVINYSYILSNPMVYHSILNESQAKKYINTSLKMSSNWEDTFNKFMNNKPVSEEEIDNLFSYFSMMCNFKKEKSPKEKYVQDKMEEYLAKRLSSNVIPKRDSEKLFIFNYCSRYCFAQKGYNGTKRNIRLMNIPSDNGVFTGGYQYFSFIAMNDHASGISNFYNELYQMIQTIMHETTHASQELDASRNPDNIHGMEMAIQKLFGFKDYQRGCNYLFNEIEENAQRDGYWHAGVLYRTLNCQEIADKLLEEKNEYVKNRKFQYEYVTILEDGKNKRISKEKYNVINIRKIVKQNPDIINKYPVLKNIFKENGDCKSFKGMLTEEFISHDIEKMYSDFLLYDLSHNSLDDISFINDEEKKNAISKLNKLLYDEVDYVIDILKDVDFRNKNVSMTNFFYKNHMSKIIIISKFLEKELSFMHSLGKEPNENKYYSSYSSNIRRLLNAIEKTTNNNELTNLEAVTTSMESDLISLDENLKNDYVLDLIHHYKAYTGMEVSFNGKKYATFEEFAIQFIRKNMDRDHYLRTDDGKYYSNVNGTAMTAYDAINLVIEDLKKNNLSEVRNIKNN